MPCFYRFKDWLRWLRSLARSGSNHRGNTYRHGHHRKGQCRLSLEELETRLAPATKIWTGAGVDNRWNTGPNWQGGIAPAIGDDLAFNSGPTKVSTFNDITSGVFNAITFNGSGYTLSGNKLTLGNPSGSGAGQIVVNAGATGETIALNIQLGGTFGDTQLVTVNSSADLTITGKLSGVSGQVGTPQLSKNGQGLLTLSNDNSGFSGSIDITAGSVQITNAKALGDASAGTVVEPNAQLRVKNVTGAIVENLVVNGPGISNDGAVLNVLGVNTWAGTIKMDTDTTFGATATAGVASSLRITGQISDAGFGHTLHKEGQGTVVLAAANTYRGDTTINNGILNIQNAQALGQGGFTTTVTQSLTKAGTLQLQDPSGIGFTVVNELLILNGAGVKDSAGKPIGAIHNLNGNNTWTGDVTLGSSAPDGSHVTIGVVFASKTSPQTDLTISGHVGDPAIGGPFNLTKVQSGRLILSNQNTFLGETFISQGIINIRDSQALGPADDGATTTVNNDATLEMELRNDDIPDSITGDLASLYVTEPLTINGTGVQNAGALHSKSGRNVYAGPITLETLNADVAIGVDMLGPMANPSASTAYFPTYSNLGHTLTGDDSLTIGNFEDPLTGGISGPTSVTLNKVGDGHLILPFANSYLGPTNIAAGWVTVQDNSSLGSYNITRGDSAQATTTVQTGAALHMLPLNLNVNPSLAQDLTLTNNFILKGLGIKHPYTLINEEGALLSLGGKNEVKGGIQLAGEGEIGVGVQQAFVSPAQDAAFPSELTSTGVVANRVLQAFSQNAAASGGSAEDVNIIDTGATSGTIIFNWEAFGIPDQFAIYYPPRPGGTKIFDTGLISGNGTATVVYSGNSTKFEIVVNEGGGQPGTAWIYDFTVIPDVDSGKNSLTKLGQRRLNMQGQNTYSGPLEIKEGVLRAQSDMALGPAEIGAATSLTTVWAGAALELAASNPQYNGGISGGIQAWDEQIILAGAGNSYYNVHPLTVMSGTDLAGNPLAADHILRGKLSLSTSSVFDIRQDSRLILYSDVDDAPNASQAGSDLIKVGAGELVLAGNSSYRGTTYIGVGIGGSYTRPDGTMVTVDGGAVPVVAGGIVTVSASQGLGAAGTSEVQSVSVTGPAGGTFTLADSRNPGESTILPIGASASAVQTALNALSSISGQGGSVNVTKSGPIGGATVYTITFLGALTGFDLPQLMVSGSAGVTVTPGTVKEGKGGTVVSDGSTLQLGGSITVAGESLVISGSGAQEVPSSANMRWFNMGPGPILSGPTPGAMPVAGRVTGVAVETPLDSSDPNATFVSNTIYVTTAGGGAWKTINGGQSWIPLLDAGPPSASAAANASVFTGAIAIAPSEPSVIYLGTGEATNSGQSHYGSGIYKSTDSGRTWTLLTDPAVGNPLNGLAVSKLVVDPTNADIVYVATSDLAINNPNMPFPLPIPPDPSNVGVWRHNGTGWLNITAIVSAARAGSPDTPGPDDDTGVTFPQVLASWSDLAFGEGATAGRLYAALGTWYGDSANAVYWCDNPDLASPIWMLSGFPNGGGNGDIKFTIEANSTAIFGVPTLFASIASSGNYELSDIQVSYDGGNSWDSFADLPPFPNDDYMGSQGWYNNAILAVFDPDPFYFLDVIYVAGRGKILQAVYDFADNQFVWTNIAVDVTGKGPHANFHGLAFNASPSQLLAAPRQSPIVAITDGGVWSLNDARPNRFEWANLNGTGPGQGLANTTFLGIAQHPTNPNLVWGGSQDNGSVVFNNDPAWGYRKAPPVGPYVEAPIPFNGTDLASGLPIANTPTAAEQAATEALWVTAGPEVHAGQTRIDPVNPKNIYHTQNSSLYRSTNGGGANSWSAVSYPTFSVTFTNAWGKQNVHQLEIADFALTGTNASASVSTTIQGAPAGGGPGIDEIQTVMFGGTITGGTFKLRYTDDLGNSITSRTITWSSDPFVLAYFFDEFSRIYGIERALRWLFGPPPPGGPPFNIDVDINFFSPTVPFVLDKINPNRLLMGGTAGPYVSTNQGLNWTALTPLVNLPPPPAPATLRPLNISSIAIATYQGPWTLDPDFAQTLDQGANTYDANTIYISDGSRLLLTKNNGQSWVDRTSNLPALVGTTLDDSIADIVVDPANRDIAYLVRNTFDVAVAKVFMTTDAGQNWTDISAGLPDVPAWKLVIDPRSGDPTKSTLYLGTDQGVWQLPGGVAGGNTWVPFGAGGQAGVSTAAATGLANVQVRDLELNLTMNLLTAGTYGRGMWQFFLPDALAASGALRSVSGPAVWAGPIMLAGDTVVSAGGSQALANQLSTASLDIIGIINDLIPDADHELTKIGGGNVILSGANNYGGLTRVRQGVLVVGSQQGLGGSASGTIVEPASDPNDPATFTALQLQTSVTTGEPLFLSGDGIPFNGYNSGALRNVSGNNSYNGPITLAISSTIGADSGTTLTITGTIDDGNTGLTVTKEGTGTLVFAPSLGTSGNSHTGGTNVNQGILRVTHDNALGAPIDPAVGTTVLSGAKLQLSGTLEVQKVSVAGTTGTFTLTFSGPGSGPKTTTALAFNASASGVQDALNALGSIGGVGGFVSVARAGTTYTVTFLGSLSGVSGLPLMTVSSSSGGPTVSVSRVSAGRTTAVPSQVLDVSGTGTFNTGALESINGNNTWGGPINMNQLVPSYVTGAQAPLNVAFGAPNVGDILTVGGTVGDNGLGLGLTKVGQGKMVLTQADSYTGTTTVSAGMLAIREAQALGDSGVPVTAEVQNVRVTGTAGTFTLTFNGQTTAALKFNAPPVVSVAGNTSVQDALRALSSIGGVGGSVDVNKVGSLYTITFGGSLAGFDLPVMIAAAINGTTAVVNPSTAPGMDGHGGTVVAAGAMLQLDLDPASTGTPQTVNNEPLWLNGSGVSSSGGAKGALENLSGDNSWSGAAVLLNSNSSIGVAVGSALNVDSDLAGASSTTLTKVGPGTLALSQNNTFAGSTTIQQGTLLAGGPNPGKTIGAVTLSGGTLGGTGTVGSITSATAGGSVSPGDSPGALNVAGPVVWNSATIFFVELNGTGPGQFDALNVTGTVNLGNATLTGSVGLPSSVGDSFIIIQASGNISGAFASSSSGGSTVFISGLKFSITITNSGATHTVTLQRVASSSSTAVTSSQNPSVFGQNVIFTATVTAEGGGSPATGSVDFIIDGTTVTSSVAVAAGQATYQTSTLTVSGSPHSVIAKYADASGNYSNSSNSLAGGQTVNKANSAVAVSSSVNPSILGENVTFSAVVSAVSPGSGIPAGTVNFVIDGSTAASGVALSSGLATYQTSTLTIAGSPHAVVVQFTATNGNYNNSSGSLAGGQTVSKSNSSLAVSSSANPSAFGQNVTFTAVLSAVSPGTGTPAGTVSFVIDGSTVTSGVALSGGQATFQTSTLNVAASPHSVVIHYTNTDGNFNNSSGTLAGGQTVTRANTSVAIGSSANPSVFGQNVTFTAVVSAVSPGTGTPAGTVNFVIDGTTVLSNVALVSGQATYQTSTLSIAVHSVVVSFTDSSGSYNNSSGSLAGGQTVVKANSAVAVSASANPSVFGQNVTFTAVVSAASPGSGTPAGTVNFVIDGSTVISNVTLAGGMATFQTSTLSIAGSPHSVTVNYANTDGNFNNNSGSLAGGQTVVKANSAVAVSSSANPSVFGQNVTFTATVSAVSPGSGTPAGTVNFVIDGTTAITGVALSGATATYQTSTLTPAGSPHAIVASYIDSSGNFNNSSGALAGGQTVNKGNTSVAVSTSSASAVYGENVTFTVTVSAVSPGSGTPAGTVSFVIDGSTAISGLALSGGQATYQTSTLGVPGSPHSVIVRYSNTGDNFNNSSGSLAGGQTITKADTTTTLDTTNSTAVYGEAIITATVDPVSPGAGTPTGTVTFHVDDGSGTTNIPIGLSGNVATLTPPLNVGIYLITASYDADPNFLSSNVTAPLSQIVIKADSSVTVNSSANPSVFGQNVTLTVTVGAVSPGSGTPGGTVDFIVDGATVASNVTLSGGMATYQTATLNIAGSPHTVDVNYTNSDGNFNNSFGALSGGQVVDKADSLVTVSSSVNPSNYNQNVTFTVAVTAQSPGAGSPAGTVDFIVDGTAVASNIALAGGMATYQTATLTPGAPHSVVVSFFDSTGNFNDGSGSLAGGQTVNKINSTVAVSTSLTPSVYGQDVTITATVAGVVPGPGTPAGTVDFIIDGSTVAAGVALSGGQATFQTSSLPNPVPVAGSPHSVVAKFTDSDGYFNNNSGALAGGQTVKKASTSTTLNSTNTNSVYGEAIITATVAAVAPGSGTPTGTVIFHVTKSGVTTHTTVALSGNVATLPATLTVGTYSITASYNADPNFLLSNTTAALSQAVSKADSALAVSSSGDPSVFRQTVTFTASVTAVSPGTGTPAGKVTFVIDGTTVASNVSVVGGQATYKTSTLSVSGSPHAVTANFAATDGKYNNSSGGATQSVDSADSSVTVSSSKNPSALGQSVTFTAIVKAMSPGSGTPTGTVDFVIDGATTITKTLSSGKATYVTSSLTDTGSPHSVDAFYHNSSGNYNDNSNALAGGQTVLNASKLSASKPSPAVNTLFSITVKALASNGALVPGYTGTATLTLISGPGKLSGKKTVSFVKGKAVFKDLKVSKPGAYFVKIMTSTGLEMTFKFTTATRWS